MVFSGDIMVKIYIGCDNKYGGIDQLKILLQQFKINLWIEE